MTYVVTISNINATNAVELKQILTNDHGMVDGQDFTWAYTPRREDWMNGILEPATVEFKFVDQSTATFFQLKYSR